MKIVACLKWIDRSPAPPVASAASVPPVELSDRAIDDRFAGMSAADEAALEWALRAGEAWGIPVAAVTVGPPGADAVLRAALSAGCATAMRIDCSAATSVAVAGAVAASTGGEPALVCCGDYSADGGSGSVPAFIADALGAKQMLGLLDLTIGSSAGDLAAVRRLDGGRRERLRVGAGGSTVISVEGATAALRRAGLAATLAARRATIPVVAMPGPAGDPHPVTTRPYRPRARVLPPPESTRALDRVRALTAAEGAPATATERVVLEPGEAADRIVSALRAWGYLA